MSDMLNVKKIITFLSDYGIDYEVEGNFNVEVESYCQLSQVSSGRILWVKNWTEEIRNELERYVDLIVVCKNDAIIETVSNCYILCEEPKMVFFEILSEFYVKQERVPYIAESAVVKTDKIGQNCTIGEFSVIGAEVEIGDDVIVEHHVTIGGKVKIGNGCVIHSGCVIGKPGFGYYTTPDGHYKRVPHLGGIVIGECVEIGANSCIDRGTIGDTTIGNHVKIDNMCHIAHNVSIGDDSMIIAMSLLGGSSCLERNAYIAPGALVMNQKTIGENGFVGMGAVVVKDVPAGKVVAGVPAKVIRDNV